MFFHFSCGFQDFKFWCLMLASWTELALTFLANLFVLHSCKTKFNTVPYWALSTNFWIQKGCWPHPAMFCLITSSKLSCQLFEFSLKVKVMGSNAGYLLKSFLLYPQHIYNFFELINNSVSKNVLTFLCLKKLF